MTQEYVKMLRDELKRLCCVLDDVDRIPIEAMLDAPIPAATLRPMSEAPRDGSQVLIYSNQHDPPWFVCKYIAGQWFGGASYLPDTPHWVKGWLPLPEVAAIQAAEEGK